MQPFSKAIMTDSGSRLFMKAQAGETKIKFTRIAVGDGDYSEEERKISSQQIKTEMKSLKNSYPISKIEVVSDHSVKVTALITNYDPISEEAVVNTGYYINEMGLFAKESEDEEGETEVLYSIAIVEGETGDFMPPFDGNNPAQIIQEYYATVNNAEDVTIEMGKGAVALAEDLEKLKILDFDDSGEVEGIESFTDFMSLFVTGTNRDKFLADFKTGLKYVLHAGKLVNSGMCETPGEFALDAAYGKTLTDQITGLYSEIYENNNAMSYIQYWLEHGNLPDPNSNNRYLYYNGAEYETITGGWSGSTSGSATISKQTDHVLLKVTDGNSYTYLNTVNKISLNGYSKLVLVRSKTANNNNYLAVKLDSTNIFSASIPANIAKSAVEYDISSYNGSYVIGIELASGGAPGNGSNYDFKLYEVYLKK